MDPKETCDCDGCKFLGHLHGATNLYSDLLNAHDVLLAENKDLRKTIECMESNINEYDTLAAEFHRVMDKLDGIPCICNTHRCGSVQCCVVCPRCSYVEE